MNRVVTALFICTLSIPINSFAENSNNDESDSWRFMIAPYAWIFGMNGTLTLNDTTSDVSTTPMDTLEMLGDIDFIGELHVELTKDRWTLLFDPTYLKLTQDVSVGPIGASITPEITFVDFGAFYSLAESSLIAHQKPAVFQVLAGGRYYSMKAKIAPDRLPSVSGDQDFLTPIIGARVLAPLSKNWKLALRGDYGGFDIDDVTETWSASVLGNYSFNQKIELVAGFRVLAVNFEKGSGQDRFDINMRFWGPLIGVAFRG